MSDSNITSTQYTIDLHNPEKGDTNTEGTRCAGRGIKKTSTSKSIIVK